MVLNNELKSKTALLDKVQKKKPGAPAPKPPGQMAPQDFKSKPAGVFIEMKDELAAKDKEIEQLNDKIIVLEH